MWRRLGWNGQVGAERSRRERGGRGRAGGESQACASRGGGWWDGRWVASLGGVCVCWEGCVCVGRGVFVVPQIESGVCGCGHGGCYRRLSMCSPGLVPAGCAQSPRGGQGTAVLASASVVSSASPFLLFFAHVAHIGSLCVPRQARRVSRRRLGLVHFRRCPTVLASPPTPSPIPLLFERRARIRQNVFSLVPPHIDIPHFHCSTHRLHAISDHSRQPHIPDHRPLSRGIETASAVP